jgi:hypothetical protein
VDEELHVRAERDLDLPAVDGGDEAPPEEGVVDDRVQRERPPGGVRPRGGDVLRGEQLVEGDGGSARRAPGAAAPGAGPGGPVEAVFADGKYYIKGPEREELYDFDKDPEEQENLAKSEAGRALLEYYRELLSKRKGLAE